jgi:hypothetical protein
MRADSFASRWSINGNRLLPSGSGEETGSDSMIFMVTPPKSMDAQGMPNWRLFPSIAVHII